VRVGASPPDQKVVNVTSIGEDAITLDATAMEAAIGSTMAGSNIAIAVGNLDDLPLGYEIKAYVSKTGAGNTYTLNGILEGFEITGTTLSFTAKKVIEGFPDRTSGGFTITQLFAV